MADLRDDAIGARFDSLRGEGRSFQFEELQEVVSAERLEEVVPALRRVEGAVGRGLHAAGFLAYEAAPALDAAMRTAPPRPALPLVWFGIFRDRRPAEPVDEDEPDALRDPEGWRSSLTEAEYAARVRTIQSWIAAGDTYQVNFTFRLRASYRGSDRALYRRLCRSQRSEFCALIRLPGLSVVSASPELFFRWADGRLEMRPMKGTRPRGRWVEEDDASAAELLRSEKERAENLMIVDLIRNDAGRIAEFGSVRVDPLFQVESYPTVHQLTSTVHARTRSGTTLTDLFRAIFPSGSVTGAPKIRTMEIIRDLENSPRGVYTGAIGFVSPDEAVFNVPIRTLLVDREGGEVELGVGSGVTYDSRAEAEYRECRQKAAFAWHPVRSFELLETMLYRPRAGIYLLEEHLRRLQGSARYFAIPLDPARVRARLDEAVGDEAPGPLRVRLLVSRSGAIRVECRAADPPPDRLRVRIADEPVDSAEALLYHKTTWRDIYERRLVAHPGHDDVILRNEREELTEFTVGNLVVARDGAHWTPPVHCGLLPGTLRAHLLRTGALRERVLHAADLVGADAVYRLNSVQQWVPVTVSQ